MTRRSSSGFTLLELLTVMAVIITLAALILHGVGYAQKRAANERARAEIAALSVALEGYKTDNGEYPRSPSGEGTNVVIPVNLADGKFGTAIADYASLSGVFLLAHLEGADGGPRYFEPKTDMLNTTGNRYLLDPFGNPYGYSTAGTFNPTFDLWSTAGMTANPSNPAPTNNDPVDRYWITNW